MANTPRNRFDEWMELILLNWAMISLVMFYSIVLGVLSGSLMVLITGFFLSVFHIPNAFLSLFPTPAPAARILISILIASIFIITFRNTRYDCATGRYAIKFSHHALKKPALGIALLLLVLGVFGMLLRIV